MSDLDNISSYLWESYGSPMAAIKGGAMVDWVWLGVARGGLSIVFYFFYF
jgi:hypothetical protein